MLSYDDGETSVEYSYDDLGRRTGATVDYGPFTLSYSYTYTENGHIKSLTYPDGTTVEYGYDQGQLSAVHIPGLGDITRSDFTWNSAGKSMYPGGSTIERNLDPFMRHKEISAKDPGGNPVLQRKYAYSSGDNLLSRSHLSGNSTFSYDGLDRLVEAEHSHLADEKYSYDPVGNRLTSSDTNGTWSYNPNNELIGYEEVSYEYDDSGNVMAKKMNNQTVRRYHYNSRGRLSRVLDGSGNEVASYYYDPFGRRLWKEVNGEKTYFLYSEQGLIGEYKKDGTAVRTYGYRPGSKWTTNPLFQKTEGSYYWYINDRHGTPKKLISANGRVVWSAKYEAFGEAHIMQQEVRNPLRRAGQYHDEETGLFYNWHRYYAPDHGRYLRTDPLRRGLNLYLYAKNNPYRYLDPRGLCVMRDFSTLRGQAEFWAGFGDTITFGGTRWIRHQWNQAYGWSDTLNYDSGFYSLGKWSGRTWQAATAVFAVEAGTAEMIKAGPQLKNLATTAYVEATYYASTPQGQRQIKNAKDFVEGFASDTPPPNSNYGYYGFIVRKTLDNTILR